MSDALAHSDALVIDADSDLPGLSTLLDDSAAGELLSHTLPDLKIVSAECSYVRYKPGTSCLALYRVATSRGTTWAHAVAYGDQGATKLAKARLLASAANARSSRPGVDDNHNIIVWPFPSDDRLAALELTAGDDGPQQLLQRMGPRDVDLSCCRLVPLRYKPQRRFVGRLDVAGRPAAVLRIQSPATYAQARRAAKSLAHMGGVPTTRPLGHSDRHRAIVAHWLPGQPLTGKLAASESAGYVLAQLHQQSHHKLPKRDSTYEARSLEQFTAASQFLGAHLAGLIETTAQSCAAWVERLPAAAVTIHGDFHPGQVVVQADGSAALIDLDQAAQGNPLFDLGAFIARLHFEEIAGQVSENQRAWAVDELLAGYRLAGGKVEPHQVCTATASCLLKLAHEPFRHRLVDWPTLTHRLLTRANDLLQIPHPTSVRPARDRSSLDDELLPLLSSALDIPSASDRLTDLTREFYNESHLELETVELIRHKPGRRAVAAYTFFDSHGRRRRLLGKIHRKPRHELCIQRQRDLRDRGFDDQSEDGISVARPVAVVPEWNMWLQEHVPGQNGWQALAGPDRDAAARLVSAAVAKLAQAGVPATRGHGLDEELQILETRLIDVAASRTAIADRIRRVLEGCRSLSERLTPPTAAGIHRDFYPDQILLAGKRLYVLDHDLYACGDPLLDIGNFCGHLIERSLRERRAANHWLAAAEEICHDYCRLSPAYDYATAYECAEIYTTVAIARHVSISTQFTDRRRFTEPILELCERRLRQHGLPNPTSVPLPTALDKQRSLP